MSGFNHDNNDLEIQDAASILSGLSGPCAPRITDDMPAKRKREILKEMTKPEYKKYCSEQREKLIEKGLTGIELEKEMNRTAHQLRRQYLQTDEAKLNDRQKSRARTYKKAVDKVYDDLSEKHSISDQDIEIAIAKINQIKKNASGNFPHEKPDGTIIYEKNITDKALSYADTVIENINKLKPTGGKRKTKKSRKYRKTTMRRK